MGLQKWSPDDDEESKSSSSSNSDSESNGESDVKDDEQFDNGNWTMFEDVIQVGDVSEADSELQGAALNEHEDRNVFQVQVQRHRYNEDMTDLGITIRKNEDEGAEAPDSMALDSVIAEGFRITGNVFAETDQVTNICFRNHI